MDELDLSMILELQKDGRKSEAKIARALRVSGTSVRRRIQRLVGDGVIRVVAMPDPAKVGYPVSAMICMQVAPSELNKVAQRLVAEPRVHTVILGYGLFDIYIRVTFRSQQELADFVKNVLYTIPGVHRSETMHILQEAKRSYAILGRTDGRAPMSDIRFQSKKKGQAANDDLPVPLDDCDYNLILELQKDARSTDACLGRRVGVGSATVRRRISRLINQRIITIETVSNPAKVGHPMTVNIGMQVDLARLDDALASIKAMPRVQYIALITGRFDLFLWATFRSADALSDFLRHEMARVPGVLHTETLVNMEILKRDSAVLLPRKAPRRRAATK
ncbi:MAG: Lrp/AsnC family transcriptional regulator [Dehalococcoidia bacterium]|nr:Lrp/AsnC family transcriptional regulator [Dehalococcoidia bacterium]